MSKRDDNGAGFDVAALAGARFVACIETAENKHLDEGVVKQLTGGDTVSCRRLHENFWEYKPEYKIFLATNHRPSISGTDDGIWRRIRLIPFEEKIPENEKDPHFPEKLFDEREGILAWAVRGFNEWQKYGLRVPSEVTNATAEYRSEQDTLGKFFEERCSIRAGNIVEKSTFFRVYVMWCEGSNERAMSQTALTRALKDRGFVVTRTTDPDRNTVRFYQGITLRDSQDLDALYSPGMGF